MEEYKQMEKETFMITMFLFFITGYVIVGALMKK